MGEAREPQRQRVGDFEIVREIGRGGMGIVYEARQVSLNRRVALKVLGGGLGLTLSPKAVLRFRREAEAAAKLHHTNIVPIYATGEQDGTHYYAMELVEGPSLNVVVAALREEEEATKRRSDEATERRSDEGERQQRRVGTAHQKESDAATSTATRTSLPPWVEQTLTLDHTVAPRSDGSSASSSALHSGAGYFDAVARMIAEVADALDYAHKQGVIHRDIKPSNLLLSPAGRLSINDFGLARVLEQPGMTLTGEFVGTPTYMSPEQIAAGRAPLDHRTDIYSLGATLYELLTLRPPFVGPRRDQIIAQIISKDPRPPRSIDRHIPLDLETICLKAMEKDPDRRYQSGGDLAEDLRRYLNRFAISARRAGPLARTIKWCRRRPAVAGLLGLVALLGASAGVLAYGAHRSNVRMLEIQRQQAIEDAMLTAMSGDVPAAEAAIRSAELLGASTGWVHVLRGVVMVAQARDQDAIAELEHAVQLLPDSLAAKAVLASAYASGNQYEKGYYDLLDEIDHAPARSAEDWVFKGYALAWDSTTLERALASIDEALRLRESRLARVLRALVQSWVAGLTGAQADIERALEDAVIARRLLPQNVLALVAHLRANIQAATAFGQSGEEARREVVLAAAREDAQALERFPDVAWAHKGRAVYFSQVGQTQAAVAEWHRYGEITGDWSSSAAVLYQCGEYAEAMAIIERSAEGKGNVYHLVHAYCALEFPGGQARALQAYAEAVESCCPPGYSALYAQTILYLLGRKAEATERARQLRARFAEMPAPLYEWYRHIAEFQAETVSADELLRAAGSSHYNQVEARFNIGLSLLADGDRAGAIEHFRHAAETGPFSSFDHDWSLAFLQRLEQDPTWPAWIPVKEGTKESLTPSVKDRLRDDGTEGDAPVRRPASAPVEDQP